MSAPCVDCRAETLSAEPGIPTEYYVVHDELWALAGMGPHGHLCIGCLEQRLGRRLIPADFTTAPVNRPGIQPTPRFAWSYRTQRLLDRLTGTEQLELFGEYRQSDKETSP